MRTFIETLQYRNEPLFIFGIISLALALVFFIVSRFYDIEVMGTNAWYKPIKFALSIGIFSLTMAWFTYYLGQSRTITYYNWTVIILLGFEIAYIALQAGRGQLSHFNVSTPFYAALYIGMAVAATAVTLFTAYLGILFFLTEFPDLPDYYVWAIRIGIVLFVIFSLEGFVMGSQMSHTIGGPDGGEGIPFLNWSKKYGDPRVAHFVGMHALQVLPILSYYVLKNVKAVIAIGILYGLMAAYILIHALQGKIFYKL
jgi:hypothetical protein